MFLQVVKTCPLQNCFMSVFSQSYLFQHNFTWIYGNELLLYNLKLEVMIVPAMPTMFYFVSVKVKSVVMHSDTSLPPGSGHRLLCGLWKRVQLLSGFISHCPQTCLSQNKSTSQTWHCLRQGLAHLVASVLRKYYFIIVYTQRVV